MVTSFRYLGRVISAADGNWTAAVRNLTKARAEWRRMTRICIREGAETQVSEFLFKVVGQSLLIFGVETWVITLQMDRVLGSFQYQVARHLMERLPQMWEDRNC